MNKYNLIVTQSISFRDMFIKVYETKINSKLLKYEF